MSWNDLRKGRCSQAFGEYFITFNTYNRAEYFRRFDLGCLFCEQLLKNQYEYKCTWLTWVLMPDHFHGILRLGNDKFGLANVVGGLKGASARVVNKSQGRTGKVWQPSYYDYALRLENDRKQISRYIVANPLRKGLVSSIKNYPFWDSIYLD